MTLGRSHPSNTQQQVTIDVQPGGGYVVLTAAEFERFTKGEPLVRHSEDAQGPFKFTLVLERKQADPTAV